MTLAHQLLQLLPGLANLVLHHLAGHPTVRNASGPDVFRLFPESNVLVRDSGEPLLVLPSQVTNVSHRHGEERVGGNGTECKRRQSAEEDAAVARHDGAGHGSHNDVDTTGGQALARFGRGSKRGNGVGEGIFDMQGTRQEVIEAVLCGKRVRVEEESGLSDLGSQDVCRGWRRGFGLR